MQLQHEPSRYHGLQVIVKGRAKWGGEKESVRAKLFENGELVLLDNKKRWAATFRIWELDSVCWIDESTICLNGPDYKENITFLQEPQIWYDYLNLYLVNFGENYLSKIIYGLRVAVRNSSFSDPITVDYKRSVIHIIKSNSGKFFLQEYAPNVFADIREMYGYDNEEFFHEWNVDLEEVKAVSSAGKSGSFFISSKNKKFFIKSINKPEKQLFKKMIRDYHLHLKRFPNTLLLKILGFFRFKEATNKSFIVFNNILDTPVPIEEVYDLKGSKKDREHGPKAQEKGVMLDVDFIKNERKIHLGAFRDEFLEQLYLDTQLLQDYQAMDYSLLIGIHSSGQYEHPEGPGINCYNSELVKNVLHYQAEEKYGTNEIYFIGIIDILTQYNFQKKIAHGLKSIKWAKDDISTVPAGRYSERFREFVGSIVD